MQGGVAHGIGNALFECMKYDAGAQPLTTTFQDYLLPAAPDVPACTIEHVETPNPLNPLGVKGAGEGGTIPAPAAIISAIEDALSPFGVRFADMPLTPDRIVAALREAGAYKKRLACTPLYKLLDIQASRLELCRVEAHMPTNGQTTPGACARNCGSTIPTIPE